MSGVIVFFDHVDFPTVAQDHSPVLPLRGSNLWQDVVDDQDIPSTGCQMTGKATGLGIAAPRPMICRKFEDTLCVPARRAMVFRALGMMCSDDVLESSVSECQHQQQSVHAQFIALPEFI